MALAAGALVANVGVAQSATVADGAFAGTIQYWSPSLPIGPNCYSVSPEFGGSAFPVVINTDNGVTLFTGQVNVLGFGSSPCGNLVAESGLMTVNVESSTPAVDTLSCTGMSGGYRRTAGHFDLDARGSCTINGIGLAERSDRVVPRELSHRQLDRHPGSPASCPG